MADQEIASEGAAGSLVGGVAAVVAAPVEAVVQAPAAAEVAPEAAAAPIVETPAEPVAEAPAEPKPAEAPVAEVAKPVEPAKAPEAAKPEVAVEAEAPVAPVYEAFKLPEGLQVAPEQLETFTALLGENKLTQEAGQKFMDMHGEVLKKFSADMAQRQLDVFDETRAGWRKDFDKSAGNRRDTVLNDAKWAIEQIVPDETARKDLWNVLAFTGVGDHPAMINALAATAKKLRERAAPPRGVPPKGPPQRAADKRYGART